MLRAAVLFFILAIIGIFFGAYGIAGVSMEIGKILLVIFLVLAIISFISGTFTKRRTN